MARIWPKGIWTIWVSVPWTVSRHSLNEHETPGSKSGGWVAGALQSGSHLLSLDNRQHVNRATHGCQGRRVSRRPARDRHAAGGNEDAASAPVVGEFQARAHPAWRVADKARPCAKEVSPLGTTSPLGRC